MGVNFIWEEKYSVGNEEIDSQHKYLFELAKALPQTVDDGSAIKFIMALYKYALKHFGTEEYIMKKEKYPNIEQHINLHDDLIVTLTEISAKPFKNEEDLLKLQIFFYDWLLEHIMHHDKKFIDFVKQKL